MGYRSYRPRSRRDYGKERARAHIQEASEFSDQVGNADALVKSAFFSLSGKALQFLLDKYETMYGTSARQYAQQTIPKWESGEVQMSGMVAKRLFELMPPVMPIALKHQIVESIWKRYGPRSHKYVYIGPDSLPDAVLGEITRYFATLEVLYAIPSNLERRFDWLADNDVTIKQQLLNYFMDEQRKAAMASARLNLGMMLDRMKADTEGQISKLTHTIFVGNHQVEIRADPLRQGFLLSDSSRDAIRPKPKLGWPAGVAAAIAIIGGLWFMNGQSQGGSSPPPAPAQQQTIQNTPVEVQQPGTQEASQSQARASSSGVAQSEAVPRTHVALGSGGSAHSQLAKAAPLAVSEARTPPRSGCSDTAIASMEDGGATVRLANGTSYVISTSGVMRYSVAQWSTGDAVTVCLGGQAAEVTYASISNPAHFDKVEASLAASGDPTRVSCADVRLTRVGNEGALVDTTDGVSYEVSTAGVMRYSVSQWSTGDAVSVCRARLTTGTVAASLANPAHFDKIQATVVGRSQSTSVRCRAASISSVGDGGDSITTSDGRQYVISSMGVMRYSAQQWVTGEQVQVCESLAADGSTAASLENPAHFDKIQATRS